MKNLKAILILGIALITLASVQSCDNNDDKTARVQLKLIDAPGDYLEVNVEIIDIQYNTTDGEEGWQSFTPVNGYPINVDLTELIAGNSLLLSDQLIPAGMLKQIRLVLSENNTLVIEGENSEAGEPIHLDTPSALQSGLKLNLDTELEGGFSYTFILDWNIQESVVEAGNSDMYNLKPVIKVNAEVNSGSISGNIVETVEEALVAMENVSVKVYTTADVLVTETLTDVNGYFLLQGLGAGDYKLKITQEGYQEYESEVIEVSIGNIQEAGTIELILE